MFASLFKKADPPAPPPSHSALQPTEVEAAVAPTSPEILANASFPSGQSSDTSTQYVPTAAEKVVTSNPSPLPSSGGAAPMPVPEFQIDTALLPPRTTAPTVFITPTTAAASPAPFPLITVGPIIGLVTANTARVLIECNTTMTVRVRLTLVGRNVRRGRAGKPHHGPPAPPTVDDTAEGAEGASHTHQLNGHASPAVSPPPAVNTQEAAIRTGASSGSPVNAAPASFAPPPMLTQEAAIMTGLSSGSPVNAAPPSAVFPPSQPPAAASSISASSSPSERHPPSQGSPATTVGKAELSDRVTRVSAQSPLDPATDPSPTEREQRLTPVDIGAQPTKSAGTFAPSSIRNAVLDGFRDPPAPQPPRQSAVSDVQDGHVVDKDVDCTAHRVSTVTFTGLEADSRYELTFVNVKSRVTSTVTTLLDGWTVSADTPLNLAFVSCNMVSVTKDLELPDTDLWLDLRRRVALHEVDYVLHIGDQIYADEKRDLKNDKDYQLVFMTGVNMITGLPTSDWPACAVHIKELYRQLYRETWTHPPTAFVLANCPSLMIYDDHDFRDDWGNDERDSDPNSAEYYVGRCAQEVMCEYQRQLWDNVDFARIDQIKGSVQQHTAQPSPLLPVGPRQPHP